MMDQIMNYFTHQRYLALQDLEEAAMEAADANWEDAVNAYDDYLQTIRPELPECVKAQSPTPCANVDAAAIRGPCLACKRINSKKQSPRAVSRRGP